MLSPKQISVFKYTLYSMSLPHDKQKLFLISLILVWATFFQTYYLCGYKH